MKEGGRKRERMKTSEGGEREWGERMKRRKRMREGWEERGEEREWRGS